MPTRRVHVVLPEDLVSQIDKIVRKMRAELETSFESIQQRRDLP
jgi:hypothetical protein